MKALGVDILTGVATIFVSHALALYRLYDTLTEVFGDSLNIKSVV